jgi:hypothetical protein
VANSLPSRVVNGTVAASRAGGDAWIPLVGGGLLVLIVGAGGGLALKRRLQ